MATGTTGAYYDDGIGAARTDFLPPSAGAAAPTMTGAEAFQAGAPAMMAFGAITSAIGSYFSAQQHQNNLRSQQLSFEHAADMAEINARQMERAAQDVLLQGQRQIGQVTLRAGKIKAATRASQAARGLTLGVGSTAEEVATIDLMKELDRYTINANATRAAWATRGQGVNAQNQSLLAGVSAQGMGRAAEQVSPLSAAGTSLLTSAGSVGAKMFFRQ